MLISQRISAHGRVQTLPLLLWGGLVLLVGLLGIVAYQSRPSVVLAKRHAALIEGIEKRSPSRIRRLVSERYLDRWSFEREDLILSISDIGSQFLALELESESEAYDIQDRQATITATIRASGKPFGPVGSEAIRRVNQLDAPIVFTWEKESFLPQSWRLVRMDNADLPEELYGYRPGDIRRAIRGE